MQTVAEMFQGVSAWFFIYGAAMTSMIIVRHFKRMFSLSMGLGY